MTREFSTVGVVGLGTMGAGIAEVFARAGLSVIGVEASEDAKEHGRQILAASTQRARAVDRGKLETAEQTALLGRVSFSTSLSDLADVDLVIEAVPEHLELKQQIFSRSWTRSATTTSSWRPIPLRCR
ncbi:3-hydroxyacyl-CoA dehydrogenase family protein [Fodinicola feengrottensis]|uniref:3-hydroxyacyl-CoA dehydrogenase family protein n=1 Tax=Fodinicola feengrottensis TaxID=435914 RepID=UPI002441BC41|nr:3-hydroxyacyl-CoA dehydrogenase NAD-binding domain-containing protein [Fodinicola feengrottensis]